LLTLNVAILIFLRRPLERASLDCQCQAYYVRQCFQLRGGDMAMQTERAVLAGGCFWGMQELIRKIPRLIAKLLGYTGSDVQHASYHHHGTHAEAIEINFDPTITSYRTLLEFFFQIHDPTTRNRQGNDVGTSYRSAIFYVNDEQKRMAE